jgi:hypothetical protein
MGVRKRTREPQIVRGVLAGIAGGLAAAWVMNQFMAGPGKKLKQVVQSEEQNWHDDIEEVEAAAKGLKEDATMKAADAIVTVVTEVVTFLVRRKKRQVLPSTMPLAP